MFIKINFIDRFWYRFAAATELKGSFRNQIWCISYLFSAYNLRPPRRVVVKIRIANSDATIMLFLVALFTEGMA